MDANFNKLFKLLIDRRMKKNELSKTANVSTSAIARLGRQENVSAEVLIKICQALDCTMDEIMDVLPKETKKDETDEASTDVNR